MWNDSVIEAVKGAAGPELDLSTLGLGVHPIKTIGQRQQAIRMLISVLKYLSPKQRDSEVEKLMDIVSARLSENLMMTSDQVCALHRAGMGIGAHTVNHPILACLDEAQVRSEIAESRSYLENLIGERVALFAFNGKPGEDYNANHVSIVKALGFSAAVCTAWGTAKIDSDLYQIPRFLPWDKSATRFVMRLYQNYWRPVVLA
jgi:peptidoglycan/xylan/chitin deacetylase (PgdA/CDA1 family)